MSLQRLLTVEKQNNSSMPGSNHTLLNAYVDGELDKKQMDSVKLLLDNDLEAAQYVRSLRRVNSLSRAALSDALDTSSNQRRVEASLDALRDAELSRPGKPSGVHFSPYAIAASILMLAVGFGMGFVSSGYHLQQQMLASVTAREHSMLEIQTALNSTLEYTPSGKTVSWESKTGDYQAQLIPIRTLKTEDQRYCREYREIITINGQREVRQGLSCRVGKENWKKQMVLANNKLF